MDSASANRNTTTTTGSSPAWQLDVLMQKLRQKAKGTTLLDTAKSVKASLQVTRRAWNLLTAVCVI